MVNGRLPLEIFFIVELYTQYTFILQICFIFERFLSLLIYLDMKENLDRFIKLHFRRPNIYFDTFDNFLTALYATCI